MAAAILVFGVLLPVLTFVVGVGYVVITVRDHMENSPEAAKAIYDHVFLPVFVGVPEKPKPLPTPVIDSSGFDPFCESEERKP